MGTAACVIDARDEPNEDGVHNLEVNGGLLLLRLELSGG